MEGRRNIKLILEYDGTRYHGWQRQKNEDTIQSVLEDRLCRMTKEPVRVIGSGRTDAGVHARHQVCNFFTHSGMAPVSIKRGLNSLLPPDIYIRDVEQVSLDFHSRYSVKTKSYEYRIWNMEEPDTFLRNFTWHIRDVLDLEEMRRCLALLIGRHDFSSFRSSGSRNENPARIMTKSELHGPEYGILRFLFEAEGFLRHMVRNIIGTLVEVGRGKINREQFQEIFLARDRRRAGIKAPPQGLFLTMVKY